MSSISRLKEQRQANGLSLEAVHEATKIPLDVLKAIEEGYTIRSLSKFYFKGFVKMYANYLNINVSEVLSDYKEEKLPEYVPRAVENSKLERIIEKLFRKYLKKPRKKDLVIPAIILGITLSIWLIGAIAERMQAARIEKQQAVKEKTPPSETVQAALPASAERKEKSRDPGIQLQPARDVKVERPKPVVFVQTASPVQEKVQKNVTLTVRAKKDSWLSAKADGETIFQSTLKAGAVETWLANEKIEISGKNISQLEFELNGKLIGALGRQDRRAKTVVVTKNGLSVVK